MTTARRKLTDYAEGWSGPGLTVDDLQAYVDWCNSLHWVRQSRQVWFINSRRREDGTVQRYVDRRDALETMRPWQPELGEMEAIRERVAQYVASGMSQEDFNALVRRTGGNI